MLTDQIKTEIEKRRQKLQDISFGCVVIEIRHNRVKLIRFEEEFSPELLTEKPIFAKL